MFQVGDTVMFNNYEHGTSETLIPGKTYVIDKITLRDGVEELRVIGEGDTKTYCWPSEVTLASSSTGGRKSKWKLFTENYPKTKRFQFKDCHNISNLNFIGTIIGQRNNQGLLELKVKITRVYNNGNVGYYHKGSVIYVQPSWFRYCKEVGSGTEE